MKMAACTTAPKATASPILMDLLGSSPLKGSRITFCTMRIRVEPLTRTTSFTLCLSMPLKTDSISMVASRGGRWEAPIVLRQKIRSIWFRCVWDAFRTITVIHALVEGNLMRGISLLSVPSSRTSGHAYGTIMVSADGRSVLVTAVR